MSDLEFQDLLREANRAAHDVAQAVSRMRAGAPHAFHDTHYREESATGYEHPSEFDRLLDAYEDITRRVQAKLGAAG